MDNNKPIVLGKVKKGKTGKPLVVVIIFLFIGAALFFLPTIASYFGDYNVLDLIKNGQIVDFFINHDYYINKDNNISVTTTTKAIEKNIPILINNKTTIKYNNFVLNNFMLTTKDIKFTIINSTNIDFDASNYYLILYQNDKEIEKLKLTSKINESGELLLTFSQKLENTVSVTGIVKEIKENTPISSTKTNSTTAQNNTRLICIKDNNEIEYIFIQTFLTSIKDTYIFNNLNDANYENILNEYKNKTEELKSLNANSIIEEMTTGFKMITTIDLLTYQYNNNQNENYYPLNSQRIRIMREMGEKGYNCTEKE